MSSSLKSSTAFTILLVLGGTCGIWKFWQPKQESRSNGVVRVQSSDVSRSTVSEAPWDRRLSGLIASTDGRSLKERVGDLDLCEIGDLLERLQYITGGENCSEINRVLLANWAERDLSGMAAWFAERMAADGLHQDGRDVLVRTLLSISPQDALNRLGKGFPSTLSLELYAPFFRELGRSNPLAAAAGFDALRQNPQTSAALLDDLAGQLANQWAGSDVRQAVAWVETLPEGSIKASALIQLSEEWMKQDPAAAAAYAAMQSNASFAAKIAMIQAEINPAAALRWAESLPAGPARDQAIVAAAEGYARQDLIAAVSAVWDLPTGATRDRAWLRIIESWTEESPAEADFLIKGLSGREFKARAAARVAETWSLHDPEKVDQWLRTLPNGAQRDAAIDSFTGALASSAPGYTFQWANCIENGALRNQCLERAALAWIQTDPANAGQAILSSTLPQAIKAQLIASISVKNGSSP